MPDPKIISLPAIAGSVQELITKVRNAVLRDQDLLLSDLVAGFGVTLDDEYQAALKARDLLDFVKTGADSATFKNHSSKDFRIKVDGHEVVIPKILSGTCTINLDGFVLKFNENARVFIDLSWLPDPKVQTVQVGSVSTFVDFTGNLAGDLRIDYPPPPVIA